MSAEDPPTFQVRPISLSATFSKYSPVKRFIAQRQYARDLKKVITDAAPDVVLSGNTPIDIQAELLWHCRRCHVGFVHWVQDVYSHAIEFFFRRKLGPMAKFVSVPFTQLEKTIARTSDASVVISPAFAEILKAWQVDPSRIAVLENWAPLDEVEYLPRNNVWSDAQGLQGKTVFLYSGTMGLKHRPDLLYKLAESLDDNCAVVVVTEGIGRDYLASLPPRENLRLLDFQPYSALPNVLASADVLVATLESEAGKFAVPSKILSYLCAGRPILLCAPEDNLAAEVVRRSGAGFVAPADSLQAWTQAARLLSSDAEMRTTMGVHARTYAEESFDIRKIAIAFEQTLSRSCRSKLAKVTPIEEPAAEIQRALPPTA
jgi:glycosyltransferase involved in cell wall biosynthesis